MSDRFAAFRHRSYSKYFAARFLGSFAVQILSVSIGWQIYDMTRDPAMLGWVGLVQFLPALLLVIVTGVAADRFGRRLVMGLALMVETGCALCVFGLALAGLLTPALILLVLVFFGIARAFFTPAASSLAVNLVPTEDFANAVAWNASSWQAASIIGPVAGGLLYGGSPLLAYGSATAILALGSVLIFTIPKPLQLSAMEPATWRSVLGGFSYIWKEKVVLGAISLDLFAVLLAGAVALMPVYARDILALGPWGLGVLRAAPGIGALMMVVYITAVPIKAHAGKILFVSVALFGAATVLFGHSRSLWLSLVALMLVGGFDMISVYIRETLMQLWTPDRVRGRVNAVNAIFLGASNELGEFRAGFMAARFGTVFTVVAGGYAAIAVAGLWAKLFPDLRKAQHLDGRD